MIFYFLHIINYSANFYVLFLLLHIVENTFQNFIIATIMKNNEKVDSA